MPDQNMLDQNKDKQLDDLVESLLSSYSDAEPRPGLETRILAQVRHATEKKSWLWNLGWVAAGAAIVTILFMVYFSRPVTRPHQETIEAVKPAFRPQLPGVVARPMPRSKASGRPIERRVAPEEAYGLAVKDRPAVFPTPVALSEQEKLFFRYLASTPSEEVIAQSHRDEVVDGLPEDQSTLPTIVPTKQSVPSSTQ